MKKLGEFARNNLLLFPMKSPKNLRLKYFWKNDLETGIKITDFQTPDKTSDTIKYLLDILKIHRTS